MVPSQPADGQTSAILSLTGLYDLLVATEPSWVTLPAPLPLFLHEAEQGLAETLGVGGDAH